MAESKSLWGQGAVPIPNRLFDEVLPTLTDTQLRVLLVILRATLGWREGSENGGWRFKRRDWVTHSQFVKRTGRRSEAISTAIQSLIEMGLIVVEDTAGKMLDTPEKRRRHVGRLYFRPVDMWITHDQVHTGKAKTTTYNKNNKRKKIQLPLTVQAETVHFRGTGWQRVAVIRRSADPSLTSRRPMAENHLD